MDWWNRCLRLRISDCLADRNIIDSGKADNVTSCPLLDLNTSEPVKGIEFRHSSLFHFAVKLRDYHLVT